MAVPQPHECVIRGESLCLTFRPEITTLVLGRKGAMEAFFLCRSRRVKTHLTHLALGNETTIAEIGTVWTELAFC